MTDAPTPIGELIDNLKTKVDELNRMNDEVKAMEEEVRDMKAQVQARLDAEGLNLATGSRAKVFLSTRMTPRLTDIEAFQQYMLAHNAPYLYQQRLAVNAVKEWVDMEGNIPGVDIIPITTLNVRKL